MFAKWVNPAKATLALAVPLIGCPSTADESQLDSVPQESCNGGQEWTLLQ